MSHYLPQPAYRESGVEHIRIIPKQWGISKVKYIGEYLNGYPFKPADWHKTGTPIVRIQNLSDREAEFNRTEEQVPERYRVNSGDILISWSASLGVYRWDRPFDAWLNQHIFKATVNESLVTKRYFPWLADWFIAEMDRESHGSTMQHLTWGKFGGFSVPLPSREEQILISDVLDRETARIDALIAKKAEFIRLLAKKRQALITRAVTKGLDPKAKMRYSGVEWIGDVPEHWEVRRLASLFREVARPGDPSLPILSISIHDGITDDELAPEDRDRRVSQIEDRTKYKRVAPKDIAYNMMRAWQGAFGAVTVDGLVSPAYVVAEPTEEFRTEFIEGLLRTPMAIEEMRRYSRGIADFRMRLYWDYFRDLKVCLPPLDEQEEILRTTSKEVARIDLLVEKSQHSIDLLKQRRSALITAAVTGQIDLREAA